MQSAYTNSKAWGDRGAAVAVYTNKHLCVPVPKAGDGEGWTQCLSVTLANAHCQPARTGKSLPNTDPAREQTLALQSKELSQVSYTTSMADRLGLHTQSRNHKPLQPRNAETSKQFTTTCLRCSTMHFPISCPAHVLHEAVKTTTFLHSSQVSSVTSKAPSTDWGIQGASYPRSESRSPLPHLRQETGPS